MLPLVSLKNAAGSLTNVPSACGAPVANVATDWPKGPASYWSAEGGAVRRGLAVVE
jgi:hypothetical protein